MDKPVNWFAPGNRQGSLYENQQVDLGPFSGWCTLGVQENTFGACSYIGASGHRCWFDNGRVDTFCFNLNVDGNCSKTYVPIPPQAMGTRILRPRMARRGIRSMASSKVVCAN